MSAKLNPFTGRLQLGGGSGGGGGGGITTIAGNSGTATGATVNLETAGTTLEFTASGDTVTLDFTELNLLIGSDGPAIAGAANNVGYGRAPLDNLVDGAANTCMGWGSGNQITSGSGNVAIGANALSLNQAGDYNVAVGLNALSNFNATSLTGNIGIGQNSLSGPGFTGDGNICIGQDAGDNYGADESNNICLSHDGVPGDQNTIRIGDEGSGDDQQNKCFIAGIAPVTLAGSSPVGINSSGQMSNLGFGTSGQVLTSNGAATSPTWQAVPSGGFTQIVQQVFTTSGTYTPTAGMKYCIVEAVGGGGGGGGAAVTAAGECSAGGGGGGGGYRRGVFTAADIGASKTVTIGTGGAGGAIGTIGSPGSSTSISDGGPSLLIATGGAGGLSSPPGKVVFALGSNGGGGGILPNFGSGGGDGYIGIALCLADGMSACGGMGGSSLLGTGEKGGQGSTGAGAGSNAVNAGGGGSGAWATESQTGRVGGNGFHGVMIITEFI